MMTAMSTTVYFFLERHHLYSDSSCTQASAYLPLIHPVLVHSSYSSANQRNQSIAVADVPRSSLASKNHIYSVPPVCPRPHHWVSLCDVLLVLVPSSRLTVTQRRIYRKYQAPVSLLYYIYYYADFIGSAILDDQSRMNWNVDTNQRHEFFRSYSYDVVL